MTRPFIKITLEQNIQGQKQSNALAETPPQPFENPVYNKRVQFDVYDDNDRVYIQVIDSKVMGQAIETYIMMKELRQYMDDISIEVKELWFDFDLNSNNQQQNFSGQGDPYRPQVRINFNYMYSKYFMYEQQCREWRTQIEEDVNDYNNIERYLDQLQRPYGFLDFRAQRESNIGMSFDFIKEEAQKRNDFKVKHPELHRIEKRVIDQTVDKYVTRAVRKMGWRRANWLGVTWTLIAFQSVTNAFACYYRADFLTTLINTLAILYLNDLDGLDRDHFRWLPFLQFISIGYDTTWLFLLQDLDNES